MQVRLKTDIPFVMEQKRPIIGLVPLWDGDKSSLWMVPGYMDGIREAGAIPLMLPLTTSPEEIAQLADSCDGFLFTGGHDVSPKMYKELPIPYLVVCCPKRDIMEHLLLEVAIEKDKPVLGICRGIQFMNVFFGGTLYQDIPKQHPSQVVHRQEHPYDVVAHQVEIKKDTPLYKLLESDQIGVNSLHHQAIKDLAPHFTPMAYSPDGLVEAIYHPIHKFLWGVQWHPEFSYKNDKNSKKIFKAFVDSCLK